MTASERAALAAEFERLAGALSSERWVGFDNEEGPELATGRTVHGEYVGLVPNCDPAGDGDARDGFNADAAFAAFAANNRVAILAALRDAERERQAESRVKAALAVGHNDNCIFCGLKDRALASGDAKP